jgi:hypothetical protein
MAIGALVFYGAIAYFANRSRGSDAAMGAAGTQVIVSTVNTFVTTMIMEKLSRLSDHRWTAFWFSTLGASLWAATVTLVVHWHAHTPNFAATVIPVIWMGTGYCASYSAALVRFIHKKPAR